MASKQADLIQRNAERLAKLQTDYSAPAPSHYPEAPAAPPSLCISTTDGIVPQMFGTPSDAH